MNSRQREAEIISDILLKAASEPEFRSQLLRSPGEVLNQYNISAEAKTVIKNSIIDLTQ
ncbi:MAG TPA: hypothetical protein VH796_03215 [Nitrososphaeraceae archaeon]